MKPARRPRELERAKPRISHANISLSPREQSLLYGELEFNLSNALNLFITTQLSHGRLEPDKLKRISDAWIAKGRPRVVGFRYDIETQLELVTLHIDEFRFYGRRQGNSLEISGLLSSMRTNARALRIRTYCQPDSVIAKQISDSQSLFNMLGCSEAQQLALSQIAGFFKAILGREQVRKANQEHGEKAGKTSGGHCDQPRRPNGLAQQAVDQYDSLLLVPERYREDSQSLAYRN
jgi:hypothetical protein